MRIVLLALAGLMMLPALLLAFREGPMPNVAGGFSDPTCQMCHLDNALNADGGVLTVTGIPAAYQPAKTYAIVVQLRRHALRRGGFEMAARFASGRTRGQQAGTWRPLDDRVRIQESKNHLLQFAQHTTAGSSALVAGELTWRFEWTAPARASARIQFNTAANASNDDASPLGDYIYTSTTRSAPTGN